MTNHEYDPLPPAFGVVSVTHHALCTRVIWSRAHVLLLQLLGLLKEGDTNDDSLLHKDEFEVRHMHRHRHRHRHRCLLVVLVAVVLVCTQACTPNEKGKTYAFG